MQIMHRLQSGPVLLHHGLVSKNRTRPSCSPVPFVLRTVHSLVSNIKTRLYDSPDWTGPWDHTSVRSQNLGPDYLQISPVRSSPSPTVRSSQSSTVFIHRPAKLRNLSQLHAPPFIGPDSYWGGCSRVNHCIIANNWLQGF
jgi:hypothetical protein